MRSELPLLLLLCVARAACGDSPAPVDAGGTPDAGGTADGGATDGGATPDAGDPPIDASEADAGEGCEPEPFTAEAIVLRRQDDENAVFMRESNGDGTFAAAQRIHPGIDDNDLNDPVLGDFDGDGSIDVLGRRNGTYVLRYDSCTDTWTESMVSTWDGRIQGAGDFDGDGDLDLYGFEIETRGSEVVLLNRGDGTFDVDEAAFDLSALDDGLQIWGSAHTDDVNGDSVADIVISKHTSELSADVHALYGNGDGTFADPDLIGTIDVAGNGIDVGDVDGDGDADVLVGLDDDADPGQVFLLRNDPDGDGFSAPEEAFDVAPGAESGFDLRGFGNLRAYDWNGDGRDDAIVSIREHPGDSVQEVFLYLAGADGVFESDPITIQDSSVGRSLRIGVPAR